MAATGVELDTAGYVITNEHLQTANPNVWALGDITNPAQLKHLANIDARIVAHNLANPDDQRSVDRTLSPHAVFGHPPGGILGTHRAAGDRPRP